MCYRAGLDIDVMSHKKKYWTLDTSIGLMKETMNEVDVEMLKDFEQNLEGVKENKNNFPVTPDWSI